MSILRTHVAVLLLVATVAALAPRPAAATLRYGPVQIAGNLQSQNLVRMPDPGTFQFIQQRNSARVQLTYDWLAAGTALGRFSVPFLRDGTLVMLWRGVYDSIYDTTPDVAARQDVHGRGYGGLTLPQLARVLRRPGVLRLGRLSRGARDALRFENDLRETYVDLRFRDIPLSMRLGRQQIVWGEADNFRMLDRANSLDLTWHQAMELPPPAFGWDEIRRPFWMLKFLYATGQIGPLSQTFLEWYWNPGDWRPAKIAFLPRPWGLPLLDPLTNPIDGVFLYGPCRLSRTSRCHTLLHGTRLFARGDYARTVSDNSQVGVRFHAVTPQRVEVTLNYFYQRWSGDDGTNYAPLRGVPRTGNLARDTARFRHFFRRGIFPAEAIAPYIHTIGVSANYSEDTYTQSVFRLETVYDMGIPFFDVGKVTLIDNPALPGVTKKDMWKGMIAVDRPTWIRPLNKRSTVFLTGQFFWHHLLNNPECRAQDQARLGPDARERAGSCLVGGLDLPSPSRPAAVAFRDKIRDWEAIFSLAAFTFYRGGSVLPSVAVVADPVNQWSMAAIWSVDWVVTNYFAVNLAQRYFITPKGHSTPIFETWGLAGMNGGRSETSLRFTVQY
jgi:hypothetical protein